MSFGSTPSYPDVVDTPAKQQTKNITEAATAARDAQRQKARKASGLRGSILTGSALATGQKTVLGG